MLGAASSSVVTGAALLGTALLLQSPDDMALGILAALPVWLGGLLMRCSRFGWRCRLATAVVIAAVVRAAIGPHAALLSLGLLSIGAKLRVNGGDIRYALALLGSLIAGLGGASIYVVVVFGLLGLVANLAARVVRTVALRLRSAGAAAGRITEDSPKLVMWS